MERSFRSCAKALWRMSVPVRWRMLVSVLAGTVRIAASLAFVWASKHLVDIATKMSDAPLMSGISIFAGILALQLCVVIFANWWDAYCEVKSRNILRLDTFAKVMRSRWDGRERFLSGDTVNRLEEDVRVVGDVLIARIPGVITTLLQLVAASAYLMILAPNLLWVLLILMFSAVFGSKMFFRQIRTLMARVRARESELQQHMQESLQHRVLVLTLTNLERVLEKFGWLQADIESNTRKRLNYNAVARGLMFLGFQAGHAAAFIWGVVGILHGTVTYGMMTAFLQLVGQVQRPIAEFGRQIPAFIQAVASIERIMDLEELEQEPFSESIMLPGAPSIEVSAVSYSYPGSSVKVLDNFSASFPGGSFTVVAGPTGAGKSTLVRLILGLLSPSEGGIFIDGWPAGAALRGNFMYIPQGNSLLSGSIRSNLQLASPEATEEEMCAVLETAMAQFVFGLPEGLDTPCGEVGSGLSEGQCQRIAIARSLLRPGGILILDESTSALDVATEEALLHNLHDNYHHRKTIIFISHRQAAARFADSVVYLQHTASLSDGTEVSREE